MALLTTSSGATEVLSACALSYVKTTFQNAGLGVMLYTVPLGYDHPLEGGTCGKALNDIEHIPYARDVHFYQIRDVAADSNGECPAFPNPLHVVCSGSSANCEEAKRRH
jgi:hypothetical protein